MGGSRSDVDGLEVYDVVPPVVFWFSCATQDWYRCHGVARWFDAFGLLRSEVSCFFLAFFFDGPGMSVSFAFVCFVALVFVGVVFGGIALPRPLGLGQL